MVAVFAYRSGGIMHIAVAYQPSGSLTKLLLKNAALNLVTLTIYRFWAKTRVRQYFWQAVRLDGEPFEYTGLGRELLIGFLIVLAVLAPATLVYSVTRALLQAEPTGLMIAQGIYFFAIYILIQAASFRARRYRLSRTSWRGIRAGQDGSTRHYVGLALFWSLASAVTLGLAYPAMRLSLQRYLMSHTRFGDRYFSFEARTWPLLKRWLPIALATILFYGSLVGFLWGVWLLPDGDSAAAGAYFRAAVRERGLLLAAAVFLLLELGFLWIWYRVGEFRYFAAHTRLGEIAIVSQARTWPVTWRVILFTLVFIGFVVLMAVLLVLAGGVILAFFGKTNADLVAFLPLALLLGLLAAFLLRRFWWTLIVTTGLLRHLCETLEISGIEHLAGVAQTSAAAQKYGEGLADSFEVAG